MSKYATICDDPGAFLEGHNQELLLSPSAAASACEQALEAGLRIVGVEGGLWMNPGFMARLDSIWSTLRPPASREEAGQWNREAARFIREQAQMSPDPDLPPADVFILTAAKARL